MNEYKWISLGKQMNYRTYDNHGKIQTHDHELSNDPGPQGFSDFS